MIIKPVSIKSSLQFLIVGPLGLSEEGILIKSQNLDIDLIGISNIIYKEGYNSESIIIPFDDSFKYYWSKPKTISERKCRLLFCYRTQKKKTNLIKELNNIKDIQESFDEFVENSIIEIRKMNFEDDFNYDIKIEINEGKILWNIAPLLLNCIESK